MKKIFLIFFLSLNFISCKHTKSEYEQENNNVVEFKGAELETLKRICESLETKREYHETLADRQISYDLNAIKRDCSDTTEFDLGRFRASLRRVIGKETYLESNSTSRLLNEILTDQNGDLSPFCDKFFSGAVVENTMNVGSRKFQLTLSVGPQYDNFSIAKARANVNGAFIIFEIEKGSVFTSRSNASANYRGVLKERLIIRDCEIGADQTFRQIFISY